jgi:hypothetical protein
MGEILSAAALLTAVATILFSNWHKEISEASRYKVEPHDESNRVNRKKARDVLTIKAIPLTLLAWGTTLTFLPDCLRIVHRSLSDWHVAGSNYIKLYSSVNTALCLVVISIGGLAAYSLELSRRVFQRWRRLSGRVGKQ